MFTYYLATLIEEKNFLPCETKCFADDYRVYNIIVYTIAYNSVAATGIWLVIYLLFIAIYGPLWLMSFALTAWGSVFMGLLGFVLLARKIARSMAFPGSVKSFQRQFADNFMNRHLNKLRR